MDEHYNDIDTLIAKFLAGEASPEEAMQLDDWMNLSPVNRAAFEQAQVAWGMPYRKPESEKIWKSLRVERKSKTILFTPTRIAAGLLFLAVSSIVSYQVFRQTNPVEETFLTQKSFEQPISFSLPEKSSVTLNKKSSLRYAKNFSVDRHVALAGEAYFNVTPDKLKPFTIQAGDLEIKVLGTAFDVSAYAQDSLIRVEVVHGKVQMKHLHDSLTLLAGERGVFNKQTKRMRLIKAETHNKLAYATKVFGYIDKPLAEILEDLTLAYGVTFELEKPAVNGCRLTGEYRGMTLPVILEVITKSLDLTYTINGNRVYISGDGCL